jgi:hypothetical protein
VHLTYDNIFITNAFPWVKDGRISGPVNWTICKSNVVGLLMKQFELIQPRVVLALGGDAQELVDASKIPTDLVIKVSHPARRGWDHPKRLAEWERHGAVERLLAGR